MRGAAEQTGWEQVGADVVVQAPGLEDETAEALAALPGVEATSPVFTAPERLARHRRSASRASRLVAFDPAPMREVGCGQPAAGRPVRRAQATRCPSWCPPTSSSPTTETQLRYAQSLLPVRVVGRMDRIPGVTTGESFVAVDAAALVRGGRAAT